MAASRSARGARPSGPSRVEVLGCHGGEMAGFLAPSLLIDGSVLLDAGSFGTVLSHRRQLGIEHVLVSHSHCDHIKDLAGFADLVIGYRKTPVRVHASRLTLQVLRSDFFNNRIWPDFFSLPSTDNPVLSEAPFEPGVTFRVGHLSVRAIPVSHPVESMAFVVRTGTGSFVYTGDTGPTDALWRAVNRLRDLKLLMIETKFPNDLQVVADAAGHLTPATLARELTKIRQNGVPILLYHLKPDRIRDLRAQIAGLGDRRLRIMKIGDRFRV
jgi:ribonuclease BN (tRNA processing enzyme)